MILDLAPLRFDWQGDFHWQSEYQRVEDGNILIDYKLPGVKKEEVELSYNEDYNIITIFVEGNEYKNINLLKAIVPEKAEAELELGVLKIRAPIKDSNKIIKIK